MRHLICMESACLWRTPARVPIEIIALVVELETQALFRLVNTGLLIVALVDFFFIKSKSTRSMEQSKVGSRIRP